MPRPNTTHSFLKSIYSPDPETAATLERIQNVVGVERASDEPTTSLPISHSHQPTYPTPRSSYSAVSLSRTASGATARTLQSESEDVDIKPLDRERSQSFFEIDDDPPSPKKLRKRQSCHILGVEYVPAWRVLWPAPSPPPSHPPASAYRPSGSSSIRILGHNERLKRRSMMSSRSGTSTASTRSGASYPLKPLPTNNARTRSSALSSCSTLHENPLPPLPLAPRKAYTHTSSASSRPPSLPAQAQLISPSPSLSRISQGLREERESVAQMQSRRKTVLQRMTRWGDILAAGVLS